jgi:alcohol dehydrogenase YqhD (iron-dependent ADH family)
MLIDKRNYLERTLKENAFLEGVKKDYQKYRDYVVKEKQDQLRAMNVLKQYTEDLGVSTKLTEANIKETKRDQKDILREMEKIKMELEEIMGPSN